MTERPAESAAAQAEADDAVAAVRRAGRVDFALRVAQSLRLAGAAQPLALAFQETVTRVLPPESSVLGADPDSA